MTTLIRRLLIMSPRKPRALSPIALGTAIVAPFLYAILEPLFGDPAAYFVGALVLAAAAALVLLPQGLARLDSALARRPRLINLSVAMVATAISLGTIELAAKTLVDLGWLSVYSPMRTLLPAGTADWRLAHITADRHREPDPVLLWRPRDRPPYNAQRMKGPLAATPKPDGLLRIVAYGDSNTDGPDRGGWTELLTEALAERTTGAVEVLNAGVTGYSSHQGLLRFRQQVSELEPDIVLVSFGWNDLATPMGPPDRAFVAPPAWRLAVERTALRFESFLALRRLLLDRRSAAPPSASAEHRVPMADYAENLLAFHRLAQEHGAIAVFLTRPYRLPTATLEAAEGWRRQVPAYNRLLLELAREHGILAVDVQSAFENAERFFVDECHFDPAGHARMAELVSEALIEGGAIQGRPR